MADRLTRRTLIGAAGVAGAALLVGATLQMSSALGSRQVVLAEVGDLQSASAGDAHAFSLVFRTPKGARWQAGTYSFRHRTMGTVELFTSPVDRGAKADLYQVIVNNPS